MQYLKRLTPQTDPRQNSTANTIYVDKDTEAIKVGTGASGNSERTLGDSLMGFAGPNGTAAAPTFTFASDTTKGMYSSGANQLGLAFAGAQGVNFAAGVFDLLSNSALIRLGASSDAILTRDAANTLAVKNSTNGQTFRIYNTYTSSTNNELFSIDWQTAANVALVGTRTAATGTGRKLFLASQLSSGSGVYSGIAIDGANSSFRFGSYDTTFVSQARSVTGTNVFAFELLSSAASGTLGVFAITPTYNQVTSTAANTDLLINRTETAVGSGTQRYIDCQTGGTTQFAVSAVGKVEAARGTAIPAGGSTNVGYVGTSTSNFGVFFGSGVPTLSAAKGSLYLRSDGSSTSTRLYVNTDGGTTWTNVTTAA